MNMEPHPKRNRGDESEKMEDIQLDSQRSVSQPKRLRRPSSTRHRVIEDILQQSRDDISSYTNACSSITEMAMCDPSFVGEAHYYHLNHRRALELIHGTYVIVYARPVIAERDRSGTMIYEAFEPDIKNTICIYTKYISDRTPSHRKVNELLTSGLAGVGMLHFRSRNMNLWMKAQFKENSTAATTCVFGSDTNIHTVKETRGAFEDVLRRGPVPPEERAATLSFGARFTRSIRDLATGMDLNWGFEFVHLEFPVQNEEDRETEMYLCIGVKVPEKTDVASRFILEQRLNCPLYKREIMTRYRPNEVEYKPRYPIKKKATVVKIAPRPLGQGSSAGVMINLPPGFAKPVSPNSKAGTLPGKPTFKRWSKTREKEQDENELQRIDETVEMNVESDL